MDAINSFPAFGPYMGVSREKVVKFRVGRKARSFRVLIYAAYNAMGLIGSEHNGIAVLDEDNRSVLCDRIAEESSGYFGPSKRQLKSFYGLTVLDWNQFQAFINAHHRSRYKI